MWDLMNNLSKDETEAAFFTLFVNQRHVIEGLSGEFQSTKEKVSTKKEVKKLPRFDESSASSSDLSKIHNFRLGSSSEISPAHAIEISSNSCIMEMISSQQNKGETSQSSLKTQSDD